MMLLRRAVFGFAVLAYSLRKRRERITDRPLTDEEHRRAERLLAGETDPT